MKHIMLAATALLFSQLCSAQSIEETIYINSGTLVVSDGSEVPYYAFNFEDNFSIDQAVIQLVAGDVLELTVVNNTQADHGFTLDGADEAPMTIPSGESAVFTLDPTDISVYRFYDHFDFPTNSYLGLGSFVAVVEDVDANFFWNFRTHLAEWNIELDQGEAVSWAEYDPDFYTINNRSFPAIADDPMANLFGNVGDTIHIYMVNSGMSMHSMHFHGYHATILESSREPIAAGRSKDTFPLWPGDAMVVELVPHQPGIFPIHDHNLNAVSGGGIYLNGGALIFIDIQP
jgi:FtsP/CotA-like multicopper oxidase with cupredoxin domain